MRNFLTYCVSLILPTLFLAVLTTVGQAQPFIVNGDFEIVTDGAAAGGAASTSGGQLGFNRSVDGWASEAPDNSYNFVFFSGEADSTGVTGQFGNLQLHGPGNGTPNGLPASSPAGGNFVAMDGAFNDGPITQLTTGITNGDRMDVTFWFAGGQQFGFDAPLLEHQLVVHLGDAPDFGADTVGGIPFTQDPGVTPGGQLNDTTVLTDVITHVNHGFSPWTEYTFSFIADQNNPTLSFLALGTPRGQPPFALLDGVRVSRSAAGVPEIDAASAMTPLFLGFLLLALVSDRRSRKATQES